MYHLLDLRMWRHSNPEKLETLIKQVGLVFAVVQYRLNRCSKLT